MRLFPDRAWGSGRLQRSRQGPKGILSLARMGAVFWPGQHKAHPRHGSGTFPLRVRAVSATANICKRKVRILGQEINGQRWRQRGEEGSNGELDLVCQ